MSAARRRLPGLLAVVTLVGCGGGVAHRASRPSPARASPTAPVGASAERPAGAAPPALRARARCAHARAFDCASLAVPLDRGDPRDGGTLRLRVAIRRGPAPRGVLVFLVGGPGQRAVADARRFGADLAGVTGGYRLVLLDQRGTGAGALRCPALQAQIGYSDLAVPTTAAVRACAERLGEARRHYATSETVADLDDLRRALGADRIVLDGVSYGTFVVERYALAHPRSVRRLVLDSVVPQTGADMLQRANARAVPRVLREVCGGCAGRLPRAVRAVGGPALLDALGILSVADPTFRGVPQALRSPRRMRRLVASVRRQERAGAHALSQGLHASTLCADSPAPWGGPHVPAARRAQALALVRVRSPLGRAVAVANGFVTTCRLWPPERVAAVDAGRPLPDVPALLLAGTRDLSTPLAWARDQLRHTPGGRLVVVHGAGHSVQTRATDPKARRSVARFLEASR